MYVAKRVSGSTSVKTPIWRRISSRRSVASWRLSGSNLVPFQVLTPTPGSSRGFKSPRNQDIFKGFQRFWRPFCVGTFQQCSSKIERERQFSSINAYTKEVCTHVPDADIRRSQRVGAICIVSSLGREPSRMRDCYRASAPPVLAAAAEIFLGAWQHGVVGEYPVNVYL